MVKVVGLFCAMWTIGYWKRHLKKCSSNQDLLGSYLEATKILLLFFFRFPWIVLYCFPRHEHFYCSIFNQFNNIAEFSVLCWELVEGWGIKRFNKWIINNNNHIWQRTLILGEVISPFLIILPAVVKVRHWVLKLDLLLGIVSTLEQSSPLSHKWA